MKKYLLLLLSALFMSGFSFAQTSINTKSPENFVKVSQELKEAGKSFFVVDMSYFTDNGQKSSFLEHVYASHQVFAVSSVKPDNTFVVCAHESVIGQKEAVELLDTYRREAVAEGTGKATTTIDKHKTK